MPPVCRSERLTCLPECASLRGRAVSRYLGLALVFVLAGCSEQPQELDERITQLQKELDRTQNELQSTKQALGSFKDEHGSARTSTLPGGTGGETMPRLPPRESLESSYTAAAKNLKKQLQAQLKDAALDMCTLHNVELPSTEYPIHSSISLALHSTAGGKFQLDLPVKADAAGHWIFPEPREIAQEIEKNLAAAKPEEAAPTPAPSRMVRGSRPPSRTIPSSTTVLPPSGAGEQTVVIQWPGSNGAARSGGRGAPAAPAQRTETADTAPGAADGASKNKPAATIPADRNVLIRF